jgi:hypothetical protein
MTKFLHQCSSCAFFYEISNRECKETPEGEKVDGECRRHPPKETEPSKKYDWDKSPGIRDKYEHVCGEYEPAFKFTRSFTGRMFIDCVLSIGPMQRGCRTTTQEFEKCCSNYGVESESIIKYLESIGAARKEGDYISGIKIKG